MTLSDADDLVREHLDANPDMRHAALHDAQYAADLHRLRMTLGRLGTHLEAEDIPEEAQRRIAAGLVADVLGTDEARVTMRERARMVTEVMATNVLHRPFPF
ncbi:hypothetical protein ACFWVB_20045 [Streptomyces microflavus]|uniref:hypothetical protein n=1 Tax=Streptomyces microflavus TaxID=1919 RepID=UPI0036596511